MDMPLAEQHTVGPEKVSVTVMRKTENDLVVSQFSAERWFGTSKEADDTLAEALRVFADGGEVR